MRQWESVERWQQIETVFQEALRRDRAERDAYVREGLASYFLAQN
jgi:hypothetical protein